MLRKWSFLEPGLVVVFFCFVRAFSFFILYLLQRSYYDFYNEGVILVCFVFLFLGGLISIFILSISVKAAISVEGYSY